MDRAAQQQPTLLVLRHTLLEGARAIVRRVGSPRDEQLHRADLARACRDEEGGASLGGMSGYRMGRGVLYEVRALRSKELQLRRGPHGEVHGEMQGVASMARRVARCKGI